MCFPKGGDGGAAAEQRAAEQQRKTRLSQGTQSIDQALSPYDDNYFKTRQDAFAKNALPNLDTKFSEARKNLIYALSGKGLLQSSVAAEEQRKLDSERAAFERQVQSGAQDYANESRAGVETTRRNLLNQLYSTEDPTSAAASAAREAGMLNAPTTPDYAGDFVFTAGQNLGTANQALGGTGLRDVITKGYGNTSGRGSSRITKAY